MHRVAITGIGIVSCLGIGATSVGEALRSGRSGIVFDDHRRNLGFRSPLTGAINAFDPQSVLTKKHRKSMTDFAIQAYVAAQEAITMSGFSAKETQNEETGLVFGCDSTCRACVEQADLLRTNKESKSIGSGMVFQSMNSTITMNLNTILKTKGACWTISSACSSGGHAIGQAGDLIRYGRQERVICGGAQEINWESMCSFDALGAFSTRFNDPAAASRPFDKERDGLVPSGGAAVVVLERYDLAEKRDARILGELKGYAFSSDGGSLSVPDQNGLRSAMMGALKASEMRPENIDYICAHATSTPIGDAVEAESISAVFGQKTPFVSSTKSMTGHELWMSGASQVVYSVIMAQEGFIAPNVNFVAPDESSAKLNIISQAVERGPRNVLCNSAGFGGTNSCLIIAFDR